MNSNHDRQMPPTPTDLAAPDVDTPDALAPPVEHRPGPPARHGLRRRRLFIAPEDRDAFQSFRVVTLHEINPQSHAEFFYADQIVAHRWYLLHADEAEAASMRKAFTTELRRKLVDENCHLRDQPRTDDERFDGALAKSATDKDVHWVLKYRAAHERALERLERMLHLEKRRRELEEVRCESDQVAARAAIPALPGKMPASAPGQHMLPAQPPRMHDGNDRAHRTEAPKSDNFVRR